MWFFLSLYSKPESLWVSMRMPLLFLPVCPWFSLVNTSAPGTGDPSVFPTPSLWMTSPSYYSCRYYLRVRAFKFHDSPSKPWEEIASCPLAMCKKDISSTGCPLVPPTHSLAYAMFFSWAVRSRGPFFGFSQCGHCHWTQHGYCIYGRSLHVIMVKMSKPCIVTYLAFQCFLILSTEW